MIKTRNLVPKYYTDNSRDFQLFEHLFDLTFNVSRTAIVASDPEHLVKYDDKFNQLACKNVGFFVKGSYDSATLSSVIKNFKYLIRNKGRLSAVEDAIKILLNAQKITKDYLVLINETNDKLMIYLPAEITSTGVLEELFDYILPSGYVYSIYLQDIFVSDSNAHTYLTINNDVVYFNKEDAIITKNGDNYRYLLGLDVIDLRQNENDVLSATDSTPSVNTTTVAHELKDKSV